MVFGSIGALVTVASRNGYVLSLVAGRFAAFMPDDRIVGRHLQICSGRFGHFNAPRQERRFLIKTVQRCARDMC